ncbi:hypothetical protein NDU88_009038 [Pleurodeles waltl]|uniref:Uncharacterized protein n=1 Tax=Pleurodeles waltl TaxID=8319 RepID=A0AAV7QRR5_PLEWA|nr:hypothetical protein NDU88_009038 [Pleurodeles waltl]
MVAASVLPSTVPEVVQGDRSGNRCKATAGNLPRVVTQGRKASKPRVTIRGGAGFYGMRLRAAERVLRGRSAELGEVFERAIGALTLNKEQEFKRNRDHETNH